MSRTNVALVLTAAALAAARFLVPTRPLSPTGSYQAVAHLFVGGLLGAWLASRRSSYLWLAAALSAVELVAFFSRLRVP